MWRQRCKRNLRAHREYPSSDVVSDTYNSRSIPAICKSSGRQGCRCGDMELPAQLSRLSISDQFGYQVYDGRVCHTNYTSFTAFCYDFAEKYIPLLSDWTFNDRQLHNFYNAFTRKAGALRLSEAYEHDPYYPCQAWSCRTEIWFCIGLSNDNGEGFSPELEQRIRERELPYFYFVIEGYGEGSTKSQAKIRMIETIADWIKVRCWLACYESQFLGISPPTETHQEVELQDSLWLWHIFEHQMMDEDSTESGETSQLSEQANNTIVTQDHSNEKNSHPGSSTVVLKQITSSEPCFTMDKFMDRFVPLDRIEISSASTTNIAGGLIKMYKFPEALQLLEKLVPANAIMRNALFGSFDQVEFKFIVNSQRFNVGKLLVSVFHNSYQGGMYFSLNTALSRQHVVLDLASLNQGTLLVNQKYSRPYTRLHLNDKVTKAIRPREVYTIVIQTLSPFISQPLNPTIIDMRVLVRVMNSEFFGMTYETQNITVSDVVEGGISILSLLSGNPLPLAKQLFKVVENRIAQWGNISLLSMDKPVTFDHYRVVPQPRLFFPNSKGVCDASVMKMNPIATTSYLGIDVPSDEPDSFYALARVWGLYGSMLWNIDNGPNDLIGKLVIDPFWRHSASKVQIVGLTPLEYAAQYYSFYQGTIEIRLDFVSTMFHSGTVQLCAEIEQEAATTSVEQASSMYTKIFELGDQKTVSFTIPYIFDTYAKRTTVGYGHLYSGISTEQIQNNILIAPESKLYFSVRVINPLRATQTVPTSIDVLIFLRAGENFTLFGIKPTAHNWPYLIENMDNFPMDGYATKKNKQTVSANLNSWQEIKPSRLTTELNLTEALAKVQIQKANSSSFMMRRMPVSKWLKSEYAGIRNKAYNTAMDKESVKQLFKDHNSIFPRGLGSIVDSDSEGEADWQDYSRVEVTASTRSTSKPTNPRSTTVKPSTSKPTVEQQVGRMEYDLNFSYEFWSFDRRYHFSELRPDWVEDYKTGSLVWVTNVFTYYGTVKEPNSRRYLVTNLIPGWTFDRKYQEWIGIDKKMLQYETQMDSGEQEDQDPTADLSSGSIAYPAMTSDFQTAFSDILRRPTLIVDNKLVLPSFRLTKSETDTAANTGFYIPLQPPSFNMYPVALNANNSIWSRTLKWHPVPGIVNLFRLWRGEMRYTIVVKKIDKEYPSTVYVYTIPHTGVRILGNHDLKNATSYRNMPVFGLGYHCEMIIPSINPTAIIEVPYETENIWTTTWEVNNNQHYTWRDKGNLNSGHLVIYCDEPCRIDVFWSAGENFRLSSYVGIPDMKMEGYQYRLGEIDQPVDIIPNNNGVIIPATYEEQWGFKMKPVREFFTTVSESIHGSLDALVNTATHMSLSVNSVFISRGEEMSHLMQDARGLVKTAEGSLGVLTNGLTSMQSSILALVKAQIESYRAQWNLTADLVEGMYDMFLDVISAWVSKSWFCVAIGIFRFLSKLFLKSHFDVLPFVEKFVSIFGLESQSMSDDKFSADIIGLLLAFVGTVVGVVINPKKVNGIFNATFERLTNAQGISYFNHMLRFINTIFDTLKKIVSYLIGSASAETKALELLKQQSKEIDVFILDAQEILSSANTALFKSPHYRQKVLRVLFQALQIQRLLVQLPNNKVSPVLHRICTDVIKHCNDHWDALSACPVRREPFMLFVEGEPGIGKSHAVDAVCEAALQSVNFKLPTSGLVYFRTPGEKFWSGYTDQFAICYDEWFNLNDDESCVKMVSEMFKLKSPALFIPEQAHVDRKESHANPLLVMFNCNSAFVGGLSTYSRHVKAVMRRRDLVVKMSLKPEYAGKKLSDPKLKLTDNMEHLLVQYYEDPTDVNTLSEPIEFNDFLKYFSNRFQIDYARETTKLNRRLARFNRLVGGPDTIRINDPFALYYNRDNLQEGIPLLDQTPFKTLQEAIVAISVAVREHQSQDGTMPEPEEINWQDLVATPTDQEQEFEEPHLTDDEDDIDHLVTLTSPDDFEVYDYEAKLKPMEAHCTSCSEESALMASCENGHTKCAIKCFANTPFYWNSLDCDYCSGTYRLMNTEWIFRASGKSLDETIAHFKRLLSVNAGEHYEKFRTCAFQGVEHYMTERSLLRFTSFMIRELKNFKKTQKLQTKQRWLLPGKKFVTKFLNSVDQREECCHRNLDQSMVLVRGVNLAYVSRDGDVEDIPVTRCNSECSLTTEDQVVECFRDVLQRINVDQPLQMLVPDVFDQEVVHYNTHSWTNVISEVLAKRHYLWPVLQVVGGVSVVAMSVYGIYRHFKGAAVKHQVYDPDRSKHLKMERRRAQQVKSKPWVVISQNEEQNQDFVDENMQQSLKAVIANKVKLNMITFWINTNKKRVMVHAMGVLEHYIILPQHSMRYLLQYQKEGAEITFAPSNQHHMEKPITLDEARVISIPDHDMCFYQMPVTTKMFTKIIQYFATEADLELYLPSFATLLAHPQETGGSSIQIEVNVKRYLVGARVGNKLKPTVYNSESIVYNYSQKGLCGATLMLPDRTRPLIGVHYAGSAGAYHFEGEGLSSVVTQEMINYYINPVIVGRETVPLEGLEDCRMFFDEQVQVEYEGKLPAKKIPHIPTKSKLVPSSLFREKFCQSEKEPAILSRHDPRYEHDIDPLQAGASKHGKLTLDFPSHLINRAQLGVWDAWFSKMKPVLVDPKPLTWKQTILGLDHPAYPGMVLSKSAGYPWILTPHKSKADYVEVDYGPTKAESRVRVSSVLLKRLNEVEEMLKQGQIPAMLYVDTLKDEKRNKQKLRKLGGTRVFCSAPQEAVYVFRKYTQHFVAAMLTSQTGVCSAVGINPMSPKWAELANLLLEKSEYWSTIDYENFGPGFNIVVCKAAHDIIQQWCEEYANVQKDLLPPLFYTIIQSMHVCDDLVYTQLSGAPSGGPLTTIVNTIVHLLYLVSAWIDIVGPEVLDPIAEFVEHVCVVIYGDDGLFSVTDKWRDKFNTVTVSNWFAQYRIVSTSAEKTSEIVPYTHWTDAKFLKRGFKAHVLEGELLSPLDEDSILSTIQWVWQSPNKQEATRVNCEAALLQAYGHGPDYYANLKSKINAALRSKNIQPISLTWEDINSKFFDNDGISLDLLNDFKSKFK